MRVRTYANSNESFQRHVYTIHSPHVLLNSKPMSLFLIPIQNLSRELSLCITCCYLHSPMASTSTHLPHSKP
ncbi:hypothetical protein QVD17_10374 [Tagetes erecta]|uniref:Uncharacterized protein n=1 Tax=Tagetes erecta TaxID=13708 RepID=A0AAD8L372_TARER|nr:hypothetical protein QVD17_10374 [Tagetes erecta]